MFSLERKSPLVLNFLANLLLAGTSWTAAVYTRFALIDQDSLGYLRDYLELLPIPVVSAAFFLYGRNFDICRMFSPWHRELPGLLKASLKTVIMVILAGYNLQDSRFSRLTLVLFTVYLFPLLTLNYIFFRNRIRKGMITGKLHNALLVVGHGEHLTQFVDEIRKNPRCGISVCAWADSEGNAEARGILSLPAQGWQRVLAEQRPHGILVGYPLTKQYQQEEFIRLHYNQTIPLIVLPHLNYNFMEASIENVLGHNLLFLNTHSPNPLSLTLKRVLDVAGSALGLLLLTPLFPFIALIIKLTSPGPVFYGQKRMTMDEKIFTMWKFRSMRQGADREGGFTWTVKDDPRKTAFGSFLRKTSLDELPQLWNVLKGEMSLVGPRPERPELIQGFKTEIPGYMLRHKVRAGITGWAQVNGWRGDTSLARRIECDIQYIQHWTLLDDFKILFLTFFSGFVHKNAY